MPAHTESLRTLCLLVTSVYATGTSGSGPASVASGDSVGASGPSGDVVLSTGVAQATLQAPITVQTGSSVGGASGAIR